MYRVSWNQKLDYKWKKNTTTMETKIQRNGKQKDGESLCTAAYAIRGEYMRTARHPQGSRMATPGGPAPLRKIEAQGWELQGGVVPQSKWPELIMY
jgi:hypothetical protein